MEEFQNEYKNEQNSINIIKKQMKPFEEELEKKTKEIDQLGDEIERMDVFNFYVFFLIKFILGYYQKNS